MIWRYVQRGVAKIARWCGWDEYGFARLKRLEDPGMYLDEVSGWPVVRKSQAVRWYCIGVGEDVAFERRLIQVERAEVWLFDPTPRAAAYIRSQVPEFQTTYRPWGVWHEDGPKPFFSPRDNEHVSHSLVDIQGTNAVGFVAECYTISTIMRMLEHRSVDAVKIDAEGAGIPILNALMESDVRPIEILIEFDEIWAKSRGWRRGIAAIIKKLQANSYQLVGQAGYNYTFLRAQKGPTQS